MAFIYDDSVKSQNLGNLDRMNGTTAYLNHYANQLYLKFIANNGDRLEKIQAAKELLICERKMAFWQRHPRYIHTDAIRGIEKLKRDWAQGSSASPAKAA
ncbi:MAG: hypothetical protein ACEQSB_00685 [Undibacterium sp.]